MATDAEAERLLAFADRLDVWLADEVEKMPSLSGAEADALRMCVLGHCLSKWIVDVTAPKGLDGLVRGVEVVCTEVRNNAYHEWTMRQQLRHALSDTKAHGHG